MTSEDYNITLMPPSLEPWAPCSDKSRQIAVMMSGGVDSTVTAHLLAEQGWDVLGITMKVPTSCDGSKGQCCGAEAAFACNELKIPHFFIDVTEAFEKLIIEPFRRSYAQGLTPNPCVDCNTALKFSLVWDYIYEKFGIEYMATGHYAKVSNHGSQMHLGRAVDRTKDQSYFLYGIKAERLFRLILTLGDMTKVQVRRIAEKLNLSVADKPESMELCFAGESDYRIALTQDQADHCGTMTDMQGNTIGTHKGVANYTIGQRRGIGFAGGKPLYVGKIDAKTNTIALGTREELYQKTVTAAQLNILIPDDFTAGRNLFAKIRSYNDPPGCRVLGVCPDAVTVEFDQAQFAPTPGQKLVLYNEDDDIVAGGTITAQ